MNLITCESGEKIKIVKALPLKLFKNLEGIQFRFEILGAEADSNKFTIDDIGIMYRPYRDIDVHED